MLWQHLTGKDFWILKIGSGEETHLVYPISETKILQT